MRLYGLIKRIALHQRRILRPSQRWQRLRTENLCFDFGKTFGSFINLL
jgi:hypothetical protein